MKNIFKSIGVSILLMFHAINLKAQTGTITSSIEVDDPIFISGTSGFDNELILSSEPQETETVYFCVMDEQNEVLDSVEGDYDGNEWTAEFDMGGLEEEAVAIVARYYDGNEDLIDESEPYNFTIQPTPASIESGLTEIEADNIEDNIAYFTITISVPDTTKEIDNGIVGIGSKSFGFSTSEIILNREYDIEAGEIIGGEDAVFSYELEAFGREVSADEIDLSQFEDLEIELDEAFNPVIAGHYSASKQFFEYAFKDVSLPLPIAPANISIGAGLKVTGGIAADCYVGMDDNSGEFGFIEDSEGERTNISIGARIEGSIWATGSLGSRHIAGVRASLTAIGKIGASYNFVTVPDFESNLEFGGNLLIKGKVQLTGLAGKAKKLWCSFSSFSNCEPNNTVLDGIIWPRDNNNQPKAFGDFPESLDSLLGSGLGNINYSYLNSRSDEIDSNYIYNIPDANPQPVFANRGSSIAVAWIESDSISEHLLFSTLDATQNVFTAPIEVSNSEVMLAAPAVAIGPDGTAIIVWAQSAFEISEIDSETGVDSILDNLQVWYAVYDPLTASLVNKSRIYNPIELPCSQPNVTISDSGKALITWLAEDTADGYTDIWYAELINGNGIWYQSTPNIINDLPGNNYEVHVNFTDSTNAIAAWISDADGDDETTGNQIMVSYYDGEEWTDAEVITDVNADEEYTGLSMDFNGAYGAIAYTSIEYTEEGEGLNSIKAEVYYNGAWDEVNYFEYSDSTAYIRMPKVSISNDDIAAISFQIVDIYSEDEDGEESDDEADVDAGEVHIALKDLNDTNVGWEEVDFSTEIAQDTSILVWDMDVVLGQNNVLYTLSQEQDTIAHELYGGQYNPYTGVLFGTPSMGLVLRGMQVNPNLTIDPNEDAILPAVPTGLKDIVQSLNGIGLVAYPNPAKESITIEYSGNSIDGLDVDIYDLMGQRVKSLETTGAKNNKETYDMSGLTPGIYLLQVCSLNNRKTIKIIIH